MVLCLPVLQISASARSCLIIPRHWTPCSSPATRAAAGNLSLLHPPPQSVLLLQVAALAVILLPTAEQLGSLLSDPRIVFLTGHRSLHTAPLSIPWKVGPSFTCGNASCTIIGCLSFFELINIHQLTSTLVANQTNSLLTTQHS